MNRLITSLFRVLLCVVTVGIFPFVVICIAGFNEFVEFITAEDVR